MIAMILLAGLGYLIYRDRQADKYANYTAAMEDENLFNYLFNTDPKFRKLVERSYQAAEQEFQRWKQNKKWRQS